MIRILEKIVDYYLSKTITNKIIFLLVSSGVVLITQNLFGQIFEQWLTEKYGLIIPDLKIWGIGLIGMGLVVLIVDIKFSLIPSVFATTKTTRIIYLGEKRYQFVFDKKMRTTPTICFTKPSYNDNKYTITSWNKNGFIAEFERGKDIKEIDFWSDAWEGLNFQQKTFLAIANLFRSKENKLKKHDYESSFSQRQIDKLKNT